MGRAAMPDGNYGHGAEPSADGKLVFMSYWDSGFIELDLTNPATPVFKGRTVYPANADGDGHSSQLDEAGTLLFGRTRTSARHPGLASRRATATCGSTISQSGAPMQIGEYRTPNSIGTNDTGGRRLRHP